MIKIYTKTGDKGETSLYGGERVLKSHLRVNAYGSIDELNSLLGVVLSKLADERAEKFLNQIQKDLFLICSSLSKAPVNLQVLEQRVQEMERAIEALEKELPKISNFILPEGTESACFLYLARAVARRAERELVALSQEEEFDKKILVYFNRLSDLLFVIARFLNHKAGIVETIWKT